MMQAPNLVVDRFLFPSHKFHNSDILIDNDNGREYGTTITGGKYLTNNVYVEVSTAPATGETATSVEIDLTRNLSLVTRRTMDNDNNLSVRWFWDY